jgi:hypothetical protein
LDDPLTRTVDGGTEQKYPVLLEYAKASFERIAISERWPVSSACLTSAPLPTQL